MTQSIRTCFLFLSILFKYCYYKERHLSSNANTTMVKSEDALVCSYVILSPCLCLWYQRAWLYD